MTFINNQNLYYEKSSPSRYEFSFTGQNIAVTDVFDLNNTNSKNGLTNHTNNKYHFFSYANVDANSNLKINANTLPFTFAANNIDAGFYHVSKTICFTRKNTSSSDSQIILNPVEIDTRYSYFSGTETTDTEQVAHCRFSFHGDSTKRTPAASYSNIDYFKFKKSLIYNDESQWRNSYYRSFSQLNLEYTFESKSTDVYLPTLFFHIEDQNGNSINLNKITIYNIAFKLTAFDSSNPEVVELFS